MSSQVETSGSSDEMYMVEYEIEESEPATNAVVRAMATAADIPVEKLPALYDSIEPEALDQLLAPRINERPRADVTVEFTYYGRTVRVDGKTIRFHSFKR